MIAVDVFAALGAIPALIGARCKGAHARFDLPEPLTTDPDTKDHLSATIIECCRCPALQQCAAWLESLEPKQRPVGIVAGRILVRGNASPPYERAIP